MSTIREHAQQVIDREPTLADGPWGRMQREQALYDMANLARFALRVTGMETRERIRLYLAEAGLLLTGWGLWLAVSYPRPRSLGSVRRWHRRRCWKGRG